MNIEVSFPGLRGSNLPTKQKMASLFLEDFPDAWTEDADLTWYLEDGGYRRLSIVANPNYGIWLWYRCNHSDGSEENYISLGDAEKLNTYVTASDDSMTLEGFYISPEQAWTAVQDFLDLSGCRSEKIAWLHEDLVPVGKYWLVSSDCL